MFCFNTYECSCSSSFLLGVSSHTASRMNKFVKNLLLEALKKHPSNTLIRRKRVSKSKNLERKAVGKVFTVICESRNDCSTFWGAQEDVGVWSLGTVGLVLGREGTFIPLQMGPGICTEHWWPHAQQTKVSHPRKYLHSPETPASGWQHSLPWAAVLVWHHSWHKIDEFTSRAFGFHRGVTGWVSVNVLLSWLSKMNPCARAKPDTFMQEMLAELQENLLIEREPTSHPSFCPRGTWTLFFWGDMRKHPKTQRVTWQV